MSTTPPLPPAPVSAPSPAPAASEAAPVSAALQLKALFPALFSGAPKPLKLRIQTDIQERAPGIFSKQVLSAFLHRHTGSHAYLIALSKARHRFDLDGAPAGDLSEEHRQAALDELARRRSNHQARLAQEEQERRNRAGLLHDHQITTLTLANFCALKGITVDELEPLLEIARREAAERPRPPPAFERQHRPAPPRHGGHRGGPAKPRPPQPP